MEIVQIIFVLFVKHHVLLVLELHLVALVVLMDIYYLKSLVF